MAWISRRDTAAAVALAVGGVAGAAAVTALWFVGAAALTALWSLGPGMRVLAGPVDVLSSAVDAWSVSDWPGRIVLLGGFVAAAVGARGGITMTMAGLERSGLLEEKG